MNRNYLFPLVGIVVALLVVFFIFFAGRPDPDADVVGDGGGQGLGADGVDETPDVTGAEEVEGDAATD